MFFLLMMDLKSFFNLSMEMENTLCKPSLIVNKKICLENISRMVSKAENLGIELRPHFKTHQSHEIGRWYRVLGISKITVSSLSMAEYFASDGWSDITIAFPFVKCMGTRYDSLARRIKLNLLVSSIGNAKAVCKTITSRVNILVEIDTGQGRSGVQPTDSESIKTIIELLNQSNNTFFSGFLTHAGHSYNHTINEIDKLNSITLSQMLALKLAWKMKYPNLIVSVGDTPTSCSCNSFEGVDELRPGNFVFFDMQQVSKGICSPKNIAVALACPVVATYPERNCAIIWGGAIHLSKDFFVNSNGNRSFGTICLMNKDFTWNDPLDNLYLDSISQEHGVIKAISGSSIELIEEGQIVAILPAHSCLTVDAMRGYWIDYKEYVPIIDSRML